MARAGKLQRKLKDIYVGGKKEANKKCWETSDLVLVLQFIERFTV